MSSQADLEKPFLSLIWPKWNFSNSCNSAKIAEKNAPVSTMLTHTLTAELLDANVCWRTTRLRSDLWVVDMAEATAPVKSTSASAVIMCPSLWSTTWTWLSISKHCQKVSLQMNTRPCLEMCPVQISKSTWKWQERIPQMFHHCRSPVPLTAKMLWELVKNKDKKCENYATFVSLIREVSQIENVDLGMNADIECHTVGSLTPQNCQSQINGSFSLFVIFAFF